MLFWRNVIVKVLFENFVTKVVVFGWFGYLVTQNPEWVKFEVKHFSGGWALSFNIITKRKYFA